MGRAGRKPNTVASGLLLFNEGQEDKCLGLWLKSALEQLNLEVEKVKSDVINTYVRTWRFIYSVGKCLARPLAILYGGAGATNPPTCFVLNSPLCAVCSQMDEICQWSIDIQPFILILLNMVQQVHGAGVKSVTKTLKISIYCNAMNST